MKVPGVVGLLLVLLVAVMHLTANGHGCPGGHLGSAVTGQLW